MMNLSNISRTQESIWVDKRHLATVISLSPESFKLLRLGRKGQNGKPDTPPIWTEGIHYQKIGTRKILYNLALIENWVATRHDPHEHQAAIEQYLRSLPQNQPKQVGRSRKTSTSAA